MHTAKYITAPEQCTGCSLCANVCSQGAITMEWSPEGFLVPRVNTEACINCGLCTKLCPALQPEEHHQDELRRTIPAYGAWNPDEHVHMESSSGGIFSIIAREVISDGGCVYGVVWKDKLTAVFTKAEKEEEIVPMRGSKYTMACIGDTYRDVKTELNKGRRVLFAGTPCQVHALKTYLRKPYNKLLTVDIVCHGVPSHHLLQKYIDEAEERTGKIVSHISFRDKQDSWINYNQTKHFTDETQEISFLRQDPYMQIFLKDIALNRCCYNCRYAHFPRQGDLSLGDFWGVQDIHPEWPIKRGISILLLNSPKGKDAITSISHEKLILHLITFTQAYKKQPAGYVKPTTELPPERKHFMEEIRTTSLETLIQKYCPRKKKPSLHKKLLRELKRPFIQLIKHISREDDE